jgi:chromosome partitioning protein
MVQIAIFNNKGGVGKTTYIYHIANILADNGIRTLMVDCDSQCNLTAYAIDDAEIKKSWSDRENSVYSVIQPVVENTGDIRMRQANNISENLYLIPGDIDLSMYEDRLG